MMINSKNPVIREFSYTGIFIFNIQQIIFITFAINFKTSFPIDLFCAIICKMVMIL